MKITLITPTGDRPRCFEKLERYMERQSLAWDRWLVADDGRTETTYTLGQEVVRFDPVMSPWESFGRNFCFLLTQASGSEVVAAVEDDDWYHPDYLRSLCALLDDYDLVGESNAKYYNVAERSYRVMCNVTHASLAQTVWRGDVTSAWHRALQNYGPRFIDRRFWQLYPGSKYLLPESRYCVSLKGQVGRLGLGSGHKPTDYEPDDFGEVLTGWIGADSGQYLNG